MPAPGCAPQPRGLLSRASTHRYQMTMPDPATTPPAAAHALPTRLPDAAFALWFGKFQQLSGLATVSAGGVFALLEAGFIHFRLGAGISIGSFALAALLGVLGPLSLDRGLIEGTDVRRGVRITLMAAVTSLGMGAGALMMGLLLPK